MKQNHFNFGVVRPYMTEEQRMINRYANENEGTLPMLGHAHFKLNHYDTRTVASVAMRGLSLNGWTCKETYQWWQAYRQRYYNRYHSCSPEVLCGPKVFERVWNQLAEWLPFHQMRMTEMRWYYMTATGWDGKRRKWYFDSANDETAVAHFYKMQKDDILNEYHNLYAVEWNGQEFVNAKRLPKAEIYKRMNRERKERRERYEKAA